MKRLLFLFVLVQFLVSGQIKRSPLALTGRIFAITRGGDLKPARLADVYVFGPDAALYFEKDLSSMVMSDALRDADSTDIRTDVCATQLKHYRTAVSDTLKTAKQTDFIVGRADEDGMLSLTVPESMNYPNGLLVVVAIGQAGANDAAWESQLIIPSGNNAQLKMESPDVACLIN